MSEMVEKRVGVKKDLHGVIKLLSFMVHDKNVKIQS